MPEMLGDAAFEGSETKHLLSAPFAFRNASDNKFQLGNALGVKSWIVKMFQTVPAGLQMKDILLKTYERDRRFSPILYSQGAALAPFSERWKTKDW